MSKYPQLNRQVARALGWLEMAIPEPDEFQSLAVAFVPEPKWLNLENDIVDLPDWCISFDAAFALIRREHRPNRELFDDMVKSYTKRHIWNRLGRIPNFEQEDVWFSVEPYILVSAWLKAFQYTEPEIEYFKGAGRYEVTEKTQI
jgi:hypothetical protein